MNRGHSLILILTLIVFVSCTNNSREPQESDMVIPVDNVSEIRIPLARLDNMRSELKKDDIVGVLQKNGFVLKELTNASMVNVCTYAGGYPEECPRAVFDIVKQGFPRIVGFADSFCDPGCGSGGGFGPCVVTGCRSGFAWKTAEGWKTLELPALNRHNLPRSCQLRNDELVKNARLTIRPDLVWEVGLNAFTSTPNNRADGWKWSECTLNGVFTTALDNPYEQQDISRLQISPRMLLDCEKDGKDYYETSVCYKELGLVSRPINQTMP